MPAGTVVVIADAFEDYDAICPWARFATASGHCGRRPTSLVSF